ncbi:hypothetical protein [Salinispora cortesiana]|uniref:hypothetical protein n=1 Tax=Salinispora cortesiana TaxID=1305843 RepID=UPI0012BB8BA2|nr:hypothetical protein [Salinispora cortesiana]
MIGISGCGDDHSSPDIEAAAVRAQMAWDSAQQQYEEVQDNERRLIRSCLVEKGFEIFPEESVPPKETDDSRPSVSSDPVEAARVGYGYDPRRLPKPDSVADNSAYAKTPDSYKSALTLAKYGPPSEAVSFTTPNGTIVDIPRAGCTGEIREALYGDLKEFLRLSFTAENLVRLDTSSGIKEHPKVLAVVGPWRKCVKEAGYSGIQFPRDMRDKARDLYKGIERSDEEALDAAAASEIKIATVEATCTRSVALDEAVAAARAEGSVKSLAKYEPDLVAWNALVREASAKAQEMLKA